MQININDRHITHIGMAELFPWKQCFSTNLTYDVENSSVTINDSAPSNKLTGSTCNGGGYSRATAMKLGFVLVAVSVAIVVAVTLGDSSHQDQAFQSIPSSIIGGNKVSAQCNIFFLEY